MLRLLHLLLLLFSLLTAVAQNPSNIFQIANKNILLPCGTSCTSITAVVPHIKQSDDYIVQSIPYTPFPYANGGTELTTLYADDIYSSAINLPFSVCFYGTYYNSLVVGSNGIVTFDITNAGKRNNFRETISFSNLTPVQIPFAGGTQNSLASTYYPKAAIMGVYHDIFPFDNGLRRIEWRIEGVAPKRRFIASYKDVPMYSCTTLSTTHQIVIYESTGVIEVYVKDKPICNAWNEGLAILGMQNFSRNKAAFPVGKNASKWGSMNMNEAFRFTPASGASKFKKAELFLNGNAIATADTASGNNGELNLNFANVCPQADSEQYILRVTYASCANANDEASFEDTVSIKKEKLEISLQTENPTCTTNGKIIVSTSGVSAPLAYSLNGGPAQSSNAFTNLPEGNYVVTVRSGSSCSRSITTVLTLQDDLFVTSQPDTILCEGTSFTPKIFSNAASFNWSPSVGVSNTSEQTPVITATKSTTYTITATTGQCQKSAHINVAVKPLPIVNAGADKTIVQGDKITMEANASAGDYLWTPSVALNSATVLNPSANPVNTTTYTLRVTNNGCTSTDDVTINVASYCVNPMEAFSPNGDGINDVWLVTTGSCLQQAKVEVFNRYGAIVFKSNDYKNDWNGTYGGKPLPDGTYYFIITYQLINGKIVNQKGNVTLLR